MAAHVAQGELIFESAVLQFFAEGLSGPKTFIEEKAVASAGMGFEEIAPQIGALDGFLMERPDAGLQAEVEEVASASISFSNLDRCWQMIASFSAAMRLCSFLLHLEKNDRASSSSHR